jgi:hypothetical protein
VHCGHGRVSPELRHRGDGGKGEVRIDDEEEGEDDRE